VAAMRALAELGPIAGPPAASAIKAQGYTSAALVAATAVAQVAGGRQYGGPVNAGSLYRVNETGRPEMFTAANGNQYMLPTKSGEVTAANKVPAASDARPIVVNQHFHITGPAPDRRTMGQIGAEAARGLAIASARNN
jgi:SLT domain-containing protein